MRLLHYLVRHRPSLCIVGLVVIAGIVGTVMQGWGFITNPIPVSRFWAMLGMTTNLVLASIAMVLVYRNLHRYEPDWTWQEAAMFRGTFLLVFAGAVGYLGRAFTQPSATLATPTYTIGIVWLIWANLRPPERFESK